MERVEKPDTTDKTSAGNAAAVVPPAAATEPHFAHSSPEARKLEPDDKAKRTKHTRVQKREKELYGLVTPVFLPLLDARDTAPKKEKPQPRPKPEKLADAPHAANTGPATPMKDAEKSKEGRKVRREHKELDEAMAGEPGKDVQHADSPKKAKRSATKKSSLRQHNTSRSRRKRVSLVIDGQTVLPADTVVDPPLMSPSSETTSASNSTTSFDDLIDPRLTEPNAPRHTEHQDAVHHSLPLPMSNNIHSPAKPLVDTPSSYITEPTHAPLFQSLRSPTNPSLGPSYNAPSAVMRTVFDPPPAHSSSRSGPASPDPVYVEDTEFVAEPAAEIGFNTYVGGLHGSGVDDVDQAGSYGYPSSLGASYLESYMQHRPLKVRMDAADKAGLDEHEKRELLKDDKMDEDDLSLDIEVARMKNLDEDDEIMGSMDDF
jgi:hypothetical protein